MRGMKTGAWRWILLAAGAAGPWLAGRAHPFLYDDIGMIAENRFLEDPANLAQVVTGRTLADLVLGRDSDLIRLPWVGRRVRRWEREPLRWLGVHGMYGLYNMADRREEVRQGPPSRLAKLGNWLTGR